MFSRSAILSVLAGSIALGACGDGTTAPELTASIVFVVPAGGATGVDVNGPIVVTFSHAMRPGMEQYAALREGDVAGPTVPGVWAWSDDGIVLTFMPDEPLHAHTRYTFHLGGGMRAMHGGFVDYQSCIGQHGGQWATQQMMDGHQMGQGSMMGSGWQHPNGTYGMVFTFTTA